MTCQERGIRTEPRSSGGVQVRDVTYDLVATFKAGQKAARAGA